MNAEIQPGQIWQMIVDPDASASYILVGDKFLIQKHGPGVLWVVVGPTGNEEWLGPDYIRKYCRLVNHG